MIVPVAFPEAPEPGGHALSHGLPAVVIGLVAAKIARTGAAWRRGERLALVALAVMTAAQLLEVLGRAISPWYAIPIAGVLGALFYQGDGRLLGTLRSREPHR